MLKTWETFTKLISSGCVGKNKHKHKDKSGRQDLFTTFKSYKHLEKAKIYSEQRCSPLRYYFNLLCACGRVCLTACARARARARACVCGGGGCTCKCVLRIAYCILCVYDLKRSLRHHHQPNLHEVQHMFLDLIKLMLSYSTLFHGEYCISLCISFHTYPPTNYVSFDNKKIRPPNVSYKFSFSDVTHRR